MSRFIVTFDDEQDFEKGDVESAIQSAYPGLPVRVCKLTAETNDGELVEDADVRVEYEAKCAELLEVQRGQVHALQSIKHLQEQQQKLFDDFSILRQKYDDLKQCQTELLWEHTAAYHPELRHIPPKTIAEDDESDEKMGPYTIGEVLGEGQFATVVACKKNDDGKELALKIIKKNRIMSYNAMRRVSNEIGTLKLLRQNTHVVHITDAIQSESNLYVVTEVGGPDLFDFFDEHPDGVPESWAQDIVYKILRAIRSCHVMGICHLDLKPENILVEFDYDTNKCTEVKLCDFGLCARIDKNEELTAFCGSPGFFAPEMVTVGKYAGDCADMWSIGCILLEMVLGHEKFCDAWMAAYDFETIQKPNLFAEKMRATVDDLPAVLTFSAQLNEFVVRLLTLKADQRMSAGKALDHSWLEELSGSNDPSPTTSTDQYIDDEAADQLRALSPFGANVEKKGSCEEPVLSPRLTAAAGAKGALATSSSDPSLRIEIMKSTISERERKFVQDYNAQHTDISLPPIEPPTPNIGRARKILKQGQSLANKAEMGFPNGLDSPMQSRAQSIDETY